MADHPSLTAPAARPLDGFVCFSIYAANLAVGRLYGDLLKPLGLTYPQYLALVVLGQTDEQKVSELGEALALESSTLTPLLKRLEAAGLITRRRDAKDERVVRIALTPRGREIGEQLLCIPPAVFEAGGMTVEELTAIKASLDRLTAQLNARRA